MRRALLTWGLAHFWCCMAAAAPVALADDELAAVRGAGVALSVHLELNAGLLAGQPMQPNWVVGYGTATDPVYLVLLGLGGVVDLHALTLNVRQRGNGSDYLDLGLPTFVGMDHFGVRGVSVQSDPSVAAGTGSLGSLILNGTAGLQGHVFLWAR